MLLMLFLLQVLCLHANVPAVRLKPECVLWQLHSSIMHVS